MTEKEAGAKGQKPSERSESETEAEGKRDEARTAKPGAESAKPTGDASEDRSAAEEVTSPMRRSGEALQEWFGLPGLNGPAIEASLGASEAIIKGGAALTHELASFAEQRWRANIEVGRRLMDSGNDWSKVVDCQSGFAASAMRDYIEELTKISDLTVQTTRDAWGPVQELTGRLGRGEFRT